MNYRQTWYKHIDFLLLDIFCIIISLFFSYFLRHGNSNLLITPVYRDMLIMLITMDFLLYIFADPFRDVLKRGYLEELKKTIKLVLSSMLFSVLYLFLIKSGNVYSRITLLLTFFLYFLLSYFTRILYKNYFHNKAIKSVYDGQKSLLIICKNAELEEIKKTIEKNNYEFYQINGICTIDETVSEQGNNSIPISDLTGFISTKWIDCILIACDLDLIPNQVRKDIKDTGIPVSIKMKEIDLLEGKQMEISSIGDYNVLSSATSNSDYSKLIIKRIIDIFGGFIGCLFTILLIFIIGPIIYIKSPGNIFYVSDRVGKNGKVFKFYKFRSMIINADDYKEKLKKDNRVKDGMMFKIEDDPRIIPGIGHFIRKTSLDEFPQFFNVLKGDMSLVGTRPPTLDEWKKYTPYYRSRLSIKPGITGLWQVSGRSNITDFNEVVRLDNEYINNWSISLDIKIIFKTIAVLFKGEGSM